jgi:hypothetical protein
MSASPRPERLGALLPMRDDVGRRSCCGLLRALEKSFALRNGIAVGGEEILQRGREIDFAPFFVGAFVERHGRHIRLGCPSNLRTKLFR